MILFLLIAFVVLTRGKACGGCMPWLALGALRAAGEAAAEAAGDGGGGGGFSGGGGSFGGGGASGGW